MHPMQFYQWGVYSRQGKPLNFCPYSQFNGICPYARLHVLAAECTTKGGGVVFDPL